MRSNLLRLSAVSLMALVAVLLTGCADQEARNNADSAKKVADAASAELAKLQQDVAALKEQLDGLRTNLEQKISEKMDGIATKVTASESALREEFTKQTTSGSESVRGLLKDADARVNSRLDSYMKEDLAKEFQKMRDEIEKNRKELIGYMDLQLKELYPYAYQPKRLEGPNPPTTPTP
jgi:hypothetical protein